MFQSRRPGFRLCDLDMAAMKSRFQEMFQSRRPGFRLCDEGDRWMPYTTSPVCFSPVDRDLGFATRWVEIDNFRVTAFQSRRPGFRLCDISTIKQE